jgi:hypothetical protein
MPNRWIVTEKNLAVSRKRLEGNGLVVSGEFTLKTIVKIIRDVRFWVVVCMQILFWNGGLQRGMGGFRFWLNDLKRFSTPVVNQYGSLQAALGILYTLIVKVTLIAQSSTAWTQILVFPTVELAIREDTNIVWLVRLGSQFRSGFCNGSTKDESKFGHLCPRKIG